MTVDINILRMLKHKDDFRRVFGRIPEAALNKETAVILADYGKYFAKFPDHTTIDFDVFIPMFRVWHSSLKDDRMQVFEQVLHNAKPEVSTQVRHEMMRGVLELRMATELGTMLSKWDAGELPNINSRLRELQDQFVADAGIAEEAFIQADIHQLLEDDENNAGIKWRLECLQQSMRPLRAGDFGIIAARPDKGKTSFISSEVAYMAEQLPPGRNILWLNNEGLGKRIYVRIYQSVLGCTKTQLLKLKAANVLKGAYLKKMGRMDKIRVKDIHGMDNFSVEQVIEANNADVVIYDMIDNISGFGGEARTDQRLEEMYKWGRETAVRLGHVGLATSQISVEGDGQQFPAMSMLKDSKTGKQGACDFIVMIGAKNDPGYEAVRWIGVPKNKLRVDGYPGDPRASVTFDPMRARFNDLPLEEKEMPQ